MPAKPPSRIRSLRSLRSLRLIQLTFLVFQQGVRKAAPTRLRIAILLGLLSITQLQADDWQQAIGPHDWQFPRDHGAHPEFKTEWWYFTGNLEDEHGRPFGYQFTIFRQGVFRQPPQKESQWAIRDIYFGHFTTSDIAENQFDVTEKADRGALGESKASPDHMEVKLQDWQITTLSEVPPESYHLVATAPHRQIDFQVTAAQPLVLEGDHGLSQKSLGVGHASYYYSFPRLQTQGVLTLNGKQYHLHGTSWFDHEFSTSSLGVDQVGWDWFCLQFDTGEELMLYCLRKADRSLDVTTRGVWIDSQSHKLDLLKSDFSVEILAHWQSPKTPGYYPSKWRIHIPGLGVNLLVEPRMADQELRLKDFGDLSYWEGACRVSGTKGSTPLTGLGYTELTGYASALGKGLK